VSTRYQPREPTEREITRKGGKKTGVKKKERQSKSDSKWSGGPLASPTDGERGGRELPFGRKRKKGQNRGGQGGSVGKEKDKRSNAVCSPGPDL